MSKIRSGVVQDSSDNLLRSGSRASSESIEYIGVSVPILKGTLPKELAKDLYKAGYRKIRAVVVYPEMQDRKVVCQGVACPTVYTKDHRGIKTAESSAPTKDLYAQSSWFFRPKSADYYKEDINTPVSEDGVDLQYMDCNIGNSEASEPDYGADPSFLKRTEVQGCFAPYNRFRVDWKTLTFHSPDIEFDDSMAVLDYTAENLKYSHAGNVNFIRTFSDIDIQTETPAISSKASGFVKKTFIGNAGAGIISGLFWDDYQVDDNSNNESKFEAFFDQKASAKWMVYLWNKTGSLNNDIERPADSGVQSAVLKRKIVSNLRFTNTDWESTISSNFDYYSGLFYTDQPEIIKLKTQDSNLSNLYSGNIDTLLLSDVPDGMYYATKIDSEEIPIGWWKYTIINNTFMPVDFTSPVKYKTFAISNKESKEGATTPTDWGNYNYANRYWVKGGGPFFENLGDNYIDLVLKKSSVRIKYKSTPHLVMTHKKNNLSIYNDIFNNTLPIFELKRDFGGDEAEENILFGGRTQDAFKENVWIPCGEPQKLNTAIVDGEPVFTGDINFYYEWGDTYYQRWDCLKTYAFTPEDINQVVEIGSFMLETYTNIDGRYDRNRGQLSNLYMSPQNFNLINPVYSQLNNFFTYRIQDDDAYKEKQYPNQITWSKTKTSGADVDLWTNVTLASVLEMDGDKGKVTKLARFNNNLICFQDKGISQILYNERVQINTQDGVPIEISNSDKVQGKNYISDSVGCSNKWSMAQTPSGIYFMDSINKAIFLFNGQLANLSGTLGFNAWSKKNLPSEDIIWTPSKYNATEDKWEGFDNFVSYYDKLNQDVLFINKDTALAYSEKMSAFTSFYDYGYSPYFCSLQDTGIWLRNEVIVIPKADIKIPITKFYRHQAGEYGNFFGTQKPYWMTLIGNPEPLADKIFTNLEFRACVEGDGELNEETGKFTPTLPFDSLETWDEYQHGITSLDNLTGHSQFQHHTSDGLSSLKRKFRIWRCDIPRDNYEFQTYPVRQEGEPEDTYQARVDAYNEWLAGETEKNISRHSRKSNDRMRNPWLYLKLMKNAAEIGENLSKAEIHDIVMTYFG